MGSLYRDIYSEEFRSQNQDQESGSHKADLVCLSPRAFALILAKFGAKVDEADEPSITQLTGDMYERLLREAADLQAQLADVASEPSS